MQLTTTFYCKPKTSTRIYSCYKDQAMKLKGLVFISTVSVFMTGCAITPNVEWSGSPETVNTEMAGVDIKASPVCTSWGCNSFLIQLNNTTDQDVVVDWNRTFYVRNGQTSGTFMYEGIVYSKRSEQKSPDVVFPGGKLIKGIYPVNLVSYKSGQYGGWSHDGMPAGENGIYFNIKIGEEEYKKKVISKISVQEK